MTTTDHPDLILSDKRADIMGEVRKVIAADEARARRNHELAANAAINDHLPTISAFLEDYGTDPSNGITGGPCTDPAHALAWVTTAAGFAFEIVNHGPATDCWLLHPETGERVYRIDYQSKWEHAARHIHDHDSMVDMSDFDEPTPPADHPAEVLVDALRGFIQSIDDREVGF